MTVATTRALLRSLFAGGLLLAATLAIPSTAAAAFEGVNGKIIDSSCRCTEGVDPIITIYAPDGSGRVKLADDALAPAFSADGGKVTYTAAGENGLDDIFVMNPDGSGKTNLTGETSPIQDTEPNFSPDGSQIVFRSFRTLDSEIWVMDADGSNPTQLTEIADFDATPVYTPDGEQIVWQRGRGVDGEIFIMNADGSGKTNLTNSPGNDFAPDVSPDGSEVIFSSLRDGGAAELYSMDLDGGNVQRLTISAAAEIGAAYSPDGSRIAYTTGTGGSFDVATANADGSGEQKLPATSDSEESYVDWQPIPEAIADDCGTDINLLSGTIGDDTLRGTAAVDGISAGGGDDELKGRAGGDCLFGDRGADTVKGNGGADQIAGGGGGDRLKGGAKGDEIGGGGGNDTVIGGSGGDQIAGGGGEDVIRGSGGGDAISSGGGNDTIRPGAGKNEVDCGGGRDVVILSRKGSARIARDCERVVAPGGGKG